MHLLVMVKEPRPGRVKTRLGPPCSPEEAAELAAAAIADTLEAVVASGADRYVVALEGQPGPWLPANVEVIAQGEGNLGQRLDRAWAEVGGPGLQIGMDTPQVTPELLDGGLCRLDAGAPCVLGGADDGGWWAIGLQGAVPDLFGPVPTSRSDTGALQRNRCRALGLEVTELAVLNDVDDIEDARAVAAAAPTTCFARSLAGLDLDRRGPALSLASLS